MVPNSRIVPPPTFDRGHHLKPALHTTDSSMKEPKPTRYLSRTVPKQEALYLNVPNNSPLSASENQQQIRRIPFGEPMNLTHSLNSKSCQQPPYNQYHEQHFPQRTAQKLDLSLQSPPLCPPPSSTSSTLRSSYDRSLDPSIFQGRERSYSTDALTADDAKKKSNGRKGLSKFFKKLGKSIDDDNEDVPQVRSVGHVVSVKSSRSYHNIPLAPPPAPSAPSLRQPDDLVANLPQEYRSRLISNKPRINGAQKEGSHAAANQLLQHQPSVSRRPNLPPPSAQPVPVSRRSTSSISLQPQSSVSLQPSSPSPQPKSTYVSSTLLYHEPLKDHEPVDQTSTPPRWSASTRKSSASFSIYSTFGGGDSFTSQEALDSTTTATTVTSSGVYISPEEDTDLAQIVANNVNRRTHARIVPVQDETGSPEESDDDYDEEVFVDADEYSQEDIERERFDKRLSKRLSGGHFGSAGGLLHSIEAAQRRTNKPLPQVGSLDRSMEAKALLRQKSADALTGDHQDGFFDSPLTTSSVWNENPSLALNGFGTGLLSPSLSIDDSDGDTQEAKDMADRLWNEDDSFVAKVHMAEWLGTRKPLNSAVLVHYMDYFEFETMRLDSAFRKLCGKLYFKAEAQQIDRILEVFAKRYWKCNRQSVFGSSDVVYAVVYSLLLLNTDLHVAQGTYARMTKQAFVRNTMSTIFDQASVKTSKTWEMNMETYLKDLYISVKQNQILQPLSEQRAEYSALEKRSSLIGGRRVLEMKRNMGAIIRKSMHEPVLEESSIICPVKLPSSPLSTTQRRKRDSISSVGSGSSFLRIPSSLLSPTAPEMDTRRPSLGSVGTSFLKEGVVVRKHLLENATQKAKHRDWRECLLVVTDGELKMYAIQNGNLPVNKISSDVNRHSLLRSSGSITETLSSKPHDPTGNKYGTQLIGTISLSHSLANVLPPPGYNRQRPYVFAIQQSHGGVYLFQTTSQLQVNDWTSVCNYWAARQSKEPLAGGVSNMEYGWGDCLHDVIHNLDEDEFLRKENPIGHDPSPSSDFIVYDWLPPAPPMVASQLDEKEQYQALQAHLVMLNTDINAHREIKKKILVRFPKKHPQHVKVFANWESRSKYLLHEIIKYQNYCDALEKNLIDRSV